MILDYEYSRDKKQFSISFIKEDGNKEILHFDNIQKFLTYYPTPTGRFKSWDGSSCDVKYTYNPSKFDLKEFIYNLAPEIQSRLDGKTFPKLYTFDIETRLKSGPHGEIGMGDFTDPTVADEPIHTISLVSPNMNSVVLGDKPLTEAQVEWVRQQFYEYLDGIPFYKTLDIPKPNFKYVYFDNEERMLRFFLENVIAKVPILAGWNSIGYDWCYITSRIKNFYPNISVADGSSTHTVSYRSFTNMKGETIKLPHPTHTLILDMMDVIDTEDTQVLPTKESMNLDYISHEALGANKVEYDGNLEELYVNDYAKYVFYNLIDSILVQLNDKKFKTMDHIYMYSLYAKERIGACFSKIALTESLILKHFRTTNTKVIWENKEQVERGRLVGAYVKKPLPGRYEFAACNDFASLYPSTIRTCNLSFDNYIGAYWQDDQLDKYKRDPGYIVIGPNVFKNDGSAHKPEIGDHIVTLLDDDALDKYRNDSNYFVSVNGCVYKNDKDYTLKAIQSELYESRNHSKYLSKKLDAHIANDISHILRCYKENGDLIKLNHKVLNKYDDDEINQLKELGYSFTCGEDLVGISETDLKEIERIVKTEIVYLSNLEQAIKLMMNSIYGGVSHQAFYWFNINIANDITGESRNLIHMMEGHLSEFWKTAWQTDNDLISLRQKYNIKLKDDSTIENILSNSPTGSLATIVYGDSVDGKSIIQCRYGDDEFKTTIEELYKYCEYHFGKYGIDDQGSSHIICPFQTLNVVNGKCVWSDIKDLIVHKVSKPKWVIKTKSGKTLTITADHSLVVMRDGEQMVVKPNELLDTDRLIIIR